MFSANSSQVSDEKLYVEDVFSTYLFTGNGGTLVINNGVDLAGKGGLVWNKAREAADHTLWDTARGISKELQTNTTGAQVSRTSGTGVGAFNSNGFTVVKGTTNENISGVNYASWTFRKAPKFFDVVTYTGNGTARDIAHSLGTTPGCIIIKSTSSANSWFVQHRGMGVNDYILLDSTSAKDTSLSLWDTSLNTGTTFRVGTNGNINGSGVTYVAYLFAHDATSDGIIQCGSFTTDGSGFATVNLGWEAQWALVKRSDSTGAWAITDNMRGWATGVALNTSDDAVLFPNVANAETTQGRGYPTATGFSYSDSASAAYIYIAIRRGPMRTPTTGTSVFSPVARTGTGAVNTITSPGFVVDVSITEARNDGFNAGRGAIWFDRLRGATKDIRSYQTAAEATYTNGVTSFASNTGVTLGADLNEYVNSSGITYANWFFRRAPSFMDVVCYTGTGSARTVNHNLGVAPELMIVKSRSANALWSVYSLPKGNSEYQVLSSNAASVSGSTWWNNTTPNATTFTLGSSNFVNLSGGTFVAYLFASCPGVSKVGSYTGTGTTQTINCGFTTGARFVLIKRTDSTGNWLVADSARGIVAGNDPLLYLNSTAAEVTTLDWIDADASGFIVNQDATANANVNGATYIYLAIS